MKSDDWNIDDNILHVIHENKIVACLSLQKTREPFASNSLQHCLIAIAQIIDKYGDDYIPIFERIKSELEDDYEKQQTKLLISKITSKCLPPTPLTVGIQT